MNKKAEGEGWAIVAGIIGIILIFTLLGFIFGSITTTVIKFSVDNGKLVNPQLFEGSVSRWGYWFQDTDNGYYNVNITSGSNLKRVIENTGYKQKTVYINQFFDCANVTIINSDTFSTLSSEEICKIK